MTSIHGWYEVGVAFWPLLYWWTLPAFSLESLAFASITGFFIVDGLLSSGVLP